MNIGLKRPPDAAQLEPLQWLEQHGDALLSYALVRVGSRELAEDLVQETFLAAIESQDQYRGEAEVRTWLIGILRRRVADHYRRQSRRPKHLAGGLEGDFEPPPAENSATHSSWPADPTTAMEEEEFRTKLDECLQKLPKTIAGAFLLRVMDGLSVKELCNDFGISATNLRVRLHRARVSLRDCLAKNWL